MAEPGFEPRENDHGERQSSWARSWKYKTQKEGGDSPMAFGSGLTTSALTVLSGAPQTNEYSKDDLQTLRKFAGNGGDRLS